MSGAPGTGGPAAPHAGRRAMRNTVAYMAAGLVPNLVNLFILPVYTRFIEPGDYGLVALVVTTTTFLGAFMGLQLTNSIHRLYFDHEGEARRVYCSTMILGILMVNVAILLPLHLAGPWIARTLFPKVDLPYRPLLMLGFAFMFFQNLVNYGNAMLRVQERGRALLVSALIHTTASAGLGLYLVVGRGLGAAGLLTSMAAASAAHAAAHGWLVRAQVSLAFRWSMFREAAAYSIPIIPHSLGGLLFMYSGKYVASHFVAIASIGLYEFADKLAMVYKLLEQSFQHAIGPTFMRESKADRAAARDRFAGIITRWTALYALLWVALALLFKEAIVLLLAPSYRGCYPFVPVLMAGYLFQGLYGFAANALLFEKKTHWVPAISLTAGLLNVGLNLVLLPRFGMIAAAWTTFASFVVTFVMAVALGRRVYPLRFEWGALARILGAALLALLLGMRIDTSSLALDLAAKTALCAALAGWLLWIDPGGLRAWLRGWLPGRNA